RTLPKVINALPGAEIVTELGRYLVGEAGVYICKIIDKKISRGHTFLITDGGLHHHLSASGNFGQVIRKNYPVAVANRMSSDNKELVSVVGPLCTPLDLLADKVELPSAEPDDLVAVFQSGAYGFSASPQGFLSHPGAKEILV
ncbi:MAG: diaminopimelate decarboxylase, partial [Pseudomonadales bacterium]|nr:diaminopimelate decarboxylase [Pseudomonadales bacterium]